MINKVLLWVLAATFGLIFSFLLAFFCFKVYVNIFWETSYAEIKTSEDGTSSSQRKIMSLYKEDGIALPVSVSVSLRDSIFHYSGRFKSKALGPTGTPCTPRIKSFANARFPTVKEKYESIIDQAFDTIYSYDTTIYKLIAEKYTGKDTSYTIHAPSKPAFDWYLQREAKNGVFDVVPTLGIDKGYVRVHPKTKHQFLMLLIKDNLSFIFWLLLFYQLFRSVVGLNSKFSFSQNLTNRIFYMGLLFVSYVLISFFVDSSVASWFDLIRYQSSGTAFEDFKGDLGVSLYPYVKFQYFYLFLGILLIILHTLLKRSQQIEKEWSAII